MYMKLRPLVIMQGAITEITKYEQNKYSIADRRF